MRSTLPRFAALPPLLGLHAFIALTGCDKPPPGMVDEEVVQWEADADEMFVERAQVALDAWELELETELVSARTLNEDRAHQPRNWITSAGPGCAAPGVGQTLLDHCPLGGDVVGVCEVRSLPSGEIVDTTAVVLESFQRSMYEEGDKTEVFVHEIGHCLGLTHSAATADVMFATTVGADFPSTAELSTVDEAYGGGAREPSDAARFARLGDGSVVRHHEVPRFYVSSRIGHNEAHAAGFQEPELGLATFEPHVHGASPHSPFMVTHVPIRLHPHPPASP